ncbi:hypothetical protein GIB67_034383 [Kingdonia uniflora]|uniref:Glutaredoxin domain-containing protein n=1 Tax=Kingdonia uniflora TaxID=39325 RepID=A0A7J7NS24_9MAGN|nr:hypothetical protein GIB67_034383 [Kingdonia uniflora]
MKGVKGRFLKKLNSIKPIQALKQARVLHVGVSDGIFYTPDPKRVFSNPFSRKQQDQEPQCRNVPVLDPNDVDVSEFMRDFENEDEEMGFGEDVDNKENIGPPIKPKVVQSLVPSKEISENSNHCKLPPSEIDVFCFRKPDLNSRTLFDPNLLAAFEQAVMNHILTQEESRKPRVWEDEPPSKTRRLEENPLLAFEEKPPPGGSDSVILYTTSLRGIRKTFEDCTSIQFLLNSFKILYFERDVSMHLEFREELWRILGGRVVPPRLFIKGRYIGGADIVVTLHERGKLLELFQGMPRDQSTSPCDGCSGVRFVLCFNCNGSRKISPSEGDDILSVQCPKCNENGLIIWTLKVRLSKSIQIVNRDLCRNWNISASFSLPWYKTCSGSNLIHNDGLLDDNKGGLGEVISDWNGNCLIGFTGCSAPNTITYHELEAVLYDIKIAIKLELKNVSI